MNKKLNYVTYQTFPAQTANSLQTISNIKYLIKYGVSVNLYFPLREKQSNADINSLRDFYEFTETFNSFGIHHPYPHGKIKLLPKLWFHLSHILWSRKLIKRHFKNDRDEKDLDYSLSLIKKYNIINACYQKAQHYINLASNSLSVFDDCEEKNILQNLTSFSISRNF